MRGDAAQIAYIQSVQKFSGFSEFLRSRIEISPVTNFFIRYGLISPCMSPDGWRSYSCFIRLSGSLFCTVFLNQILAILERISPPSPLQELSKPMYLIEEALVEPTFAIELVGREEHRLIERLARHARSGSCRRRRPHAIEPGSARRRDGHHPSDVAVYGADPGHPTRPGNRARIVRLQHRVANLNSLFEALDEFVTAALARGNRPSSGRVADQMIESLHSLLIRLGRSDRLRSSRTTCNFCSRCSATVTKSWKKSAIA